MITIFNRRELTITFSLKKQAEISSILSVNNISYLKRVINRKSPSSFFVGTRARTGTFGEKLELSYEYIIYVHKNDYDRAKSLIN